MTIRFINLLATCLIALKAFFFIGPLQAAEKPLVIFAASSMKNALDEIVAHYKATAPHNISISFASTSKLARQIMNGAPAHIFVSANKQWMDALEQQKLLQANTRFNIASNRLVVVQQGSNAPSLEASDEKQWKERLTGGRLALARTKAVPAGIYAKAALQKLGVWQSLKGQFVEAKNVRATLALVALGEAKLGIVYQSDALADSRVTVVTQFDLDNHEPIIYPVAELATANHPHAKQFTDFLKSSKAKAILLRHGFKPAPQQDRS